MTSATCGQAAKLYFAVCPEPLVQDGFYWYKVPCKNPIIPEFLWCGDCGCIFWSHDGLALNSRCFQASVSSTGKALSLLTRQLSPCPSSSQAQLPRSSVRSQCSLEQVPKAHDRRFFFLAIPVACRSSWARDRTCAMAVTVLDP